uniref:RNase H type-1 domain-containing protein n=1 Tax=Cannabis sativa TaxID=3483 RepID=A0A803QLB5_CANSA
MEARGPSIRPRHREEVKRRLGLRSHEEMRPSIGANGADRDGEILDDVLSDRDASLVLKFLISNTSHSSCFWAKERSMLDDLYGQASSQRVNFEKSSVLFSSNTEVVVRDSICGQLGIYEADDNTTYLGLPNIMGRKKTAILGFLKEKLQKCTQGWEGRLLSCARKEVLLKTVAYATPSYAMSVFLLLLETCKALEDPYVHSDHPGLQDKTVHSLFRLDGKVCQEAEESTFHALVGCSFARASWNRSLVSICIWSADSLFGCRFQALSARINSQALEAAMVAWSIWKDRNDVVWQQKSPTAASMVLSARSFLNQFRFAQSRTTRGCLARNHAGQVLEAFTTSMEEIVRPEIAEIIGIKEALSWIQHHNWQNVLLETDSLVCVQPIQSELHMPSKFGLLVNDCRIILSSLSHVAIQFVERSVNKVPHCLTRSSCFSQVVLFGIIS